MWEEAVVVLQKHGLWGLLVLAFAEASFFPLAPDFLLIPMCLARPERALLFALLCTLASICGARFGYFLGGTLGQPLLRRLASRNTVNRVENMFKRYGGWAVLVAALIPLPYKIFTITSGCFSLNVSRFLVASLVGRGIRFFTEALLVIFMGAQAIAFIKANYVWVSVFVGVVLVAVYLLGKQRHRLRLLMKRV